MAAGLPAARVRAGPESRRGHLVAAQAVHGQLRRRRPGRPGPHRQAQAEDDPVPPPPDRRLPGRHRPQTRTLVTTCITSSTWLVFDTYEAAGDVKDWIESVLLPHLVSARWLRVVIIGQSVPIRAGSTWESVAAGPLTLQLPGPEDWLAYGRVNRGETIDIDFVTQAHHYADGKPSLLAGLLGPRS